MKTLIIVPLLALAACTTLQGTQQPASTEQPVPMAHAKLAPEGDPALATQGLADLDTMTFDCPKAGLNAAAREAAKVPSQGTYQFAYFQLVSDAHHATYEVHFKSNVTDEPDLRYCVHVYCQQGWDPKKTQAAVALMKDEPAARGKKQGSACGMAAGGK